MKYTFTLKGINLEDIHKKYDLKYDINDKSNITTERNTGTVTKITDLSVTDYVPIVDENKCNKLICMYDFLLNDYLPNSTIIKCFWCRNNFVGMPIGCPIKYYSSQLEKTYYSDITKDKYTLIENISKEKKQYLQLDNENTESKKKEKIQLIEKEFYETDGIFCSFNCCFAFIKENKHNSIYKNSYNLLKKIYYEINNCLPDKIIPSPSFRLLKEYGGSLDINEFRKNFNKIEYTEIGLVKNYPKFKPIGILFSEKNKL